MKLHDLRPPVGTKKKRKRVGRGISAGQGKTAGRGTKGQNSRTGGGVKPYFEGGQLPLVRRMPHTRGFNNIHRVPFQIVNLDVLNDNFDSGAEVTPSTLKERDMVHSANRVKILGRGELKKAMTIKAHAFSADALEKIKAAGGRAEVIASE